MKKIIALLLAVVMVFGLAACGGEGEAAADNNAEGKTYKVAFILNCSISDGGWGTACYSELVAAVERNENWEMAYTDNLAQDGYYDAMVAYCNEGFDLIYAPGGEYTDAVLQVAAEYPDVAFAQLNGGEDTPAAAVNGNVTSLLPNGQQIGWIAGALAGLMTETGTVAFIGGMELTTTLAKYEGFVEAAKYVGEKEGKSITALDAVYANSYDDSAKGIEFANAMMEQGADVFFGDASAIDSGARQAIDEKNKAAGSIKVFDIAQPADYLGQNECIIGSQVTDNSSLIELSFRAVEDGTFGGEVLYGNLENGVLSTGALNDLVPQEIKDKYLAYIEEMIAGTFMQ
ncbi:MAG: BMP family ABC transporter substrate-binding protein [Oscillospiraceae bacterium]|nr:BMP family ABC transporter substrate-binding protein [Oscillospiraceae bacterium]